MIKKASKQILNDGGTRINMPFKEIYSQLLKNKGYDFLINDISELKQIIIINYDNALQKKLDEYVEKNVGLQTLLNVTNSENHIAFPLTKEEYSENNSLLFYISEKPKDLVKMLSHIKNKKNVLTKSYDFDKHALNKIIMYEKWENNTEEILKNYENAQVKKYNPKITTEEANNLLGDQLNKHENVEPIVEQVLSKEKKKENLELENLEKLLVK